VSTRHHRTSTELKGLTKSSKTLRQQPLKEETRCLNPKSDDEECVSPPRYIILVLCLSSSLFLPLGTLGDLFFKLGDIKSLYPLFILLFTQCHFKSHTLPPWVALFNPTTLFLWGYSLRGAPLRLIRPPSNEVKRDGT
jgi:hypothetical protein